MRKNIEGRWLLLLLALLSVTQVLPMYPVAACNPGFTLTVSPATSTVLKGSSERLGIKVTSVCGLASTVNVGFYKTSPSNGPTLTFIRYDIWVSPTSPTGSTTITAGTTNTPKGTYTITTSGKAITGHFNGITNSTTFTITVS